MIVLGIDPGITNPGLALVRVDASSARANNSRWRALVVAREFHYSSDETAESRMETLCTEASDWVRKADLVAIEDQHAVFFGKSDRGQTNAQAAKLNALVGMLAGVALVMSRPFIRVAPQSIRSILGVSRSANKTQVAAAVRYRCVGLAANASLTISDAVAIAVAGEKKWTAEQRTKSRRTA